MFYARPKANRSGFTLVELLVVITIVGLLAGLLTVGLYAAFGRGKEFVLVNEITQMSTGVEGFKQKHGVYPPDMSDVSDLSILPGNNTVTPANLSSFRFFSAFINKAFPRADRTAIAAFCNTVRLNGGRMDQAEALVYFMSRTSKDPRFPLGKLAVPLADSMNPWSAVNYVAPQPNELESFFEFPPESLFDADQDNLFEFIQRNARGAPLVYFDARTYTSVAVSTGNAQVMFVNNGYGTTGTVTPYAANQTGTNYIFHNPKSFQLICAGLNGEFGVDLSAGIGYPLVPAKPIPSNYVEGLPRVMESDGDNIANFTSGVNFQAYLTR